MSPSIGKRPRPEITSSPEAGPSRTDKRPRTSPAPSPEAGPSAPPTLKFPLSEVQKKQFQGTAPDGQVSRFLVDREKARLGNPRTDVKDIFPKYPGRHDLDNPESPRTRLDELAAANNNHLGKGGKAQVGAALGDRKNGFHHAMKRGIKPAHAEALQANSGPGNQLKLPESWNGEFKIQPNHGLAQAPTPISDFPRAQLSALRENEVPNGTGKSIARNEIAPLFNANSSRIRDQENGMTVIHQPQGDYLKKLRDQPFLNASDGRTPSASPEAPLSPNHPSSPRPAPDNPAPGPGAPGGWDNPYLEQPTFSVPTTPAQSPQALMNWDPAGNIEAPSPKTPSPVPDVASAHSSPAQPNSSGLFTNNPYPDNPYLEMPTFSVPATPNFSPPPGFFPNQTDQF